MANYPGAKFPKKSMTGAEWLAGESTAKKNKFGAVSTNGFPSKLEANVYALLEFMQRAGEIRDLKRYPSVALTKRIRWKVDYCYTVIATDVLTFCEAKGKWTSDAALKLNLWRERGPGPLCIWEGDHKSPRLVETVIPETLTDMHTGQPVSILSPLAAPVGHEDPSK